MNRTKDIILSHVYIKPIANGLAKDLIVKNHYTHKWTICELALGVFCEGIEHTLLEDDLLLGAVVFDPPAGVNVCRSLSHLLNHENLWELKRLWIDDCLGKNVESKVIALSINYLCRKHQNIKCLVSYADPDAGHRGCIYQATNWLYQDIERPKNSSGYLFSFDEGRTWLHPRTMFNRFGTFSVEKLIEVIPRPFWVKELAVKHRYVYPLGDKIWRKKLMASFNYSNVGYPKKGKELETVRKYE